ncbi:exported hypothetical protein [Corynebacterium striatum]|nr:exported hypothetical protein [Corynebacterium striatum]
MKGPVIDMKMLASLMFTVGLAAGPLPAVEAPPTEGEPVIQTYQSIKDWLGCSKGQTHPWCSK